MLSDYGFIGLFVLIALCIPVVAIGLARLLRPKKPNPIKETTYECGLETLGDTWVRFRAQFYIFALIFVIFDIEVVFLFPWAVAYQSLGLFALLEMAIFLGILALGLVYAWRKGVLKWL